MGALLSALSVSSSYAAKKTDLWQTLLDKITDCMMPGDIDRLREEISARRMDIPYSWDEPLAELLDKQMDEIEANDISQIMRDRFDF